jgi:hypothetical protein
MKLILLLALLIPFTVQAEDLRVFVIDTIVYTDSFGKKTAWLTPIHEYKVKRVWLGHGGGFDSYNEINRHTEFTWFSTIRLKTDKVETAILLFPQGAIGFGLRVKL